MNGYYFNKVSEDVKEYIDNEVDLTEWKEDRDGLEEKLNDELWAFDSVTGNGSGSYTFSRCKAAEHVFDDMETVAEALEEFCVEAETIAEKFLAMDWEYFDVTARCHVLAQAISTVLDELETAGAFEAEAETEPEETTLDRMAAAMGKGFQDIANKAGKASERIQEPVHVGV